MPFSSMGFGKVFLVGALLALVGYVFFAPHPLFEGVELGKFQFPPRPSLTGKLDPNANNELTRAERLLKGKIRGAETCNFDSQGALYCSAANGAIYKITNVNNPEQISIEHFAQTGVAQPDCGTREELQELCGRPLQLAFNASNGHLLVIDAYRGLMEFDPAGKFVKVLSADVPTKFTNFLTISKDSQTVYFSESSTKYNNRQGVQEVMEFRPNGRILRYDGRTGKTEVVVDNITFPNGVVLSPDESFLLISETFHSRLSKYYLAGPKKGSMEVFADLPGMPDNIHVQELPGGGAIYWVAITALRDAMIDFLLETPQARYLLTKLVPVKLFEAAPKKHAMVVVLNENGEIIKSMQDKTGATIGQITGAVVDPNAEYLYLGSLYDDFVARVKLPPMSEIVSWKSDRQTL